MQKSKGCHIHYSFVLNGLLCFKLKASLSEGRGKNPENCYIFLLWAAQLQFCEDADLCSKLQRQLRARPALPQGCPVPWAPCPCSTGHLQDTSRSRLVALASSAVLLPCSHPCWQEAGTATSPEKLHLDPRGWREPFCLAPRSNYFSKVDAMFLVVHTNSSALNCKIHIKDTIQDLKRATLIPLD